MARNDKNIRRAQRDPATEAFEAGQQVLFGHPLFAPLLHRAAIWRQKDDPLVGDRWALVAAGGVIHVHGTRRAEPAEWAYALAHCLLHLGFGHVRAMEAAREWNAACCVTVTRFLDRLKLGRAPAGFAFDEEPAGGMEERLYARFRERGIPGDFQPDMLVASVRVPEWRQKIDWTEALAAGLERAVTSAVNVAAGVETALSTWQEAPSTAKRARDWFVNSYPLLGSLAAAFLVVEDPLVCRRLGISVAAVDPELREIYVNPAAGLTEQELRFVLAHELLHVGLRHDVRCRGREPFLWNASCDYAINAWLVEMDVGEQPALGLLHDPSLAGESAESIYDRLAVDLRRARKLATLRGRGVGDMLERRPPEWWGSGPGMDLDAFYRRCLAQGLTYHEQQGRGLLPSGLVEEIQALSQPPIPWDVELAQWFDERFPPLETVRTYARPSRRQSATPDIPRPRWVPDPLAAEGRTFGVVLDTSGSMDRMLLAKALGAIAGYSMAQDVPLVRVVFCDAAAYDQGYLAPEAIGGRVRVRGRGGTVLQPGIDLLVRATNFPETAPILIITDGWCDRVHVRRDHAFLVPAGAWLPFAPRGPVFRMPATSNR